MGTPKYLRERKKEKRMRRIARFRLENEMKERKYWEEGEKRRCRICGWKEKTWKRVVKVCMKKGEEGGREKLLKILDKNGEQ